MDSKVVQKDGSALVLGDEEALKSYLRYTGQLVEKTDAEVLRDKIIEFSASANPPQLTMPVINGASVVDTVIETPESGEILPPRTVFFTKVEGSIIEMLAEAHPKGLNSTQIVERLKVYPPTGVSALSRFNTRLRAHNIPLITKVLPGSLYVLNVEYLNGIKLESVIRPNTAQVRWDAENGYR